jgi:hypothetical protein
MADDKVIGAAQMGNVQVGHAGMAEALAAEAEMWARRNEVAIAKAAEAKAARDRGTNEVAEEVPYPKDKEPISAMEITNRLIGEQLVNLKRSPTDHVIRTVTFPTTAPQLLAGRRVLRETIIFFAASATVTIGVTQQSVGVGADTFTIGTTGTTVVSLDTEGPFWGTAVADTTISIIETFWDIQKVADVVEEIAHRLSGKIQQTAP